MSTNRTKWTYEMLQEEALKYSSRQEFSKSNGNAHHAAYRKGILDDICSHMSGNIVWTYEMLQKEALKYNSRGEFQHQSRKAYATARIRKILDEICSHMMPVQNTWTYEMLQKEALKYTTRKEFSSNNKKAYEAAYHHKYLDEICSHMISKIKYWTNEELYQEALKYKTRWEFGRLNKSAYQAACKRHIMDDVCSHMVADVGGGFKVNMPGFLYYIKLESIDQTEIYKIGITNLPINERISSMQIEKEFTVSILNVFYFENGKAAMLVEKLLHKKFKKHRYTGNRVMQNGYTELYNIDVLNSA